MPSSSPLPQLPFYLVLPLTALPPLASSETAPWLPFWEPGLLSLKMAVTEEDEEVVEGPGRKAMGQGEGREGKQQEGNGRNLFCSSQRKH